VNRYGSRYTYYHCSWRRLDYQCAQRSVSAEDLETQMARFVEETALPEKFHDFELERLDRLTAEDRELEAKRKQALENQAAALDRQLANLKKLRIRDILDDAEFLEERQSLTRERLRLAQEIEQAAQPEDRFEPVRLLLAFSKIAASRFREGTPEGKRVIVEILGSNPRLRDRELKIDAAKPFRRWSQTPTNTDLRAFLHEVRTFAALAESGEMVERLRRVLEGGPEEKVA
jgi:hypothetical protein